jgi:hypothetical protein
MERSRYRKNPSKPATISNDLPACAWARRVVANLSLIGAGN